MKQPWEATDEEVRTEAERIRPRRLAADRKDSQLLAEMLDLEPYAPSEPPVLEEDD